MHQQQCVPSARSHFNLKEVAGINPSNKMLLDGSDSNLRRIMSMLFGRSLKGLVIGMSVITGSSFLIPSPAEAYGSRRRGPSSFRLAEQLSWELDQCLDDMDYADDRADRAYSYFEHRSWLREADDLEYECDRIEQDLFRVERSMNRRSGRRY
ncbi:MAG: hypothetical protein AAGG02_19745 [Cyanobacteria bacterium P01_H01_bin.15]